jgi:hypothetical protein
MDALALCNACGTRSAAARCTCPPDDRNGWSTTMNVRALGASLVLLSGLAACAGWRGGETGSESAARAAPDAPVPASSPAAGSGCFEPLPGHPTAAERREFVEEVSRLATTAEERHGVPAAAVAAMAIQESGYGWTPLAQNTNNILAGKYTTAEAAGGRGSWTLDCPALGTSDRYTVFADRAEAVDFVAGQLATSDNYGADTARYREARAQGGGDVVQAVDRWVDAIADPYSSDPDAYRAAIKRVMNDPYQPSDRRSPDENLYRLSEDIAPPSRTAGLAGS